MGRYRLLRWSTLLFGALLFTHSDLSAQTTRDKYDAWRERKSAFNLNAEDNFALNVNNWLCGLSNAGEICTNTFGSTTGGGGFWPAGTGNQYVFQEGLQLAARDPLDPSKFVAAHCFNVSATNAACKPRSNIYHSDNAADLADWPAACYLYNPQTGEQVKALSQLDTCVRYWDGDPAATVPGGHPMGVEVVQHTLSFTLSGFRDMIFFLMKIKNVSNDPLFKQANPGLNVPAGGWTLNDLYVAFGSDHDVSFDNSGDNFGTFVPFLNDTTPLFLAAIWEAHFDAPDFSPYPQCSFCTVPGFVGTTFLRSPYNTTGETIHTNIAGVERDVPSISREELEPLRLAAAKGDVEAAETLKQYEIGQSNGSIFDRSGAFQDPNEASQSWRYYSGKLNDAEKALTVGSPPGFMYVNQPTPADTRIFHATGPIKLEPGDSTDVIVGLVIGAPVLDVPGFTPGDLVPHGLPGDTTRLIEKLMGRGRTDTSYPSIFKAVLDARTLFETNFLLPSPPPAPTVTAIAGNHQNSVTWSNEAVDAADPYFTVAEQRGIPGYREHDFEGYRVYRKVRPNDNWTLIAQYDLPNGLGAVVTPVETVETAEGQTVVVRADTVRFCVPITEGGTDTASCSEDTGLSFGLVDRGGSFPDPSNGPGLTNGVTYYYAVTTFDINTPFAPGGSSLESGRRLSAESQSVGGAAATPRSNAAGTVAAEITPAQLLGANGQPLDLDANVSIDPATGTFSGPQPPTNGLQVGFAVYDPQLLSPGAMSVRIDSVVPYNDCSGGGGWTCPQLFPGGLGGPDDSYNGLGAAIAYYFTITTPQGVQQVRKVSLSPFGNDFGPDAISFDVANIPIPVDKAKALELGLDTTHFAGALTAKVSYGPDYLNTDLEAVAANRFGYITDDGGSRWFIGSEPADPALGTQHGALAGVDAIIGLPDQYLKQPGLRWINYLTGMLGRAADYQLTWGDGGHITVTDVTHNLPVPFHQAYRASWGILPDASGDGIVSAGDFWFPSPIGEWFCAPDPGELCVTPMDSVVTLRPISTNPPTSTFGSNVAASDGTGFALFLNGEFFIFKMNALPAAGTVWTLRTYSGDVAKGDDGYTFTPNDTRPPTVTGLVAAVQVNAAQQADETAVTLDDVHTVPDPFIVSSALQTTSAGRHIQFVNLPNPSTVRIYSLSGVLVDAFEHDDPSGGGSEDWDLRNRNNQYVASGVYFYHVQSGGKSKVGKFTIIQAP